LATSRAPSGALAAQGLALKSQQAPLFPPQFRGVRIRTLFGILWYGKGYRNPCPPRVLNCAISLSYPS